jgi:hypothetical protein
MRLTMFGTLAVAAFLFVQPANADAACCGQDHQNHQMKAGCCDQPCCADSKKIEPSAIELMVTMDPQWTPAPPARQRSEVWFHRPTWVGKSILQGRYIIEHDNDRMARGEPCTYIYAFDDQTNPVVTFHCTHLERERAGTNLVYLIDDAASGWKRFTEFQFAGEHASHGYPTVR